MLDKIKNFLLAIGGLLIAILYVIIRYKNDAITKLKLASNVALKTKDLDGLYEKAKLAQADYNSAIDHYNKLKRSMRNDKDATK